MAMGLKLNLNPSTSEVCVGFGQKQQNLTFCSFGEGEGNWPKMNPFNAKFPKIKSILQSIPLQSTPQALKGDRRSTAKLAYFPSLPI